MADSSVWDKTSPFFFFSKTDINHSFCSESIPNTNEPSGEARFFDLPNFLVAKDISVIPDVLDVKSPIVSVSNDITCPFCPWTRLFNTFQAFLFP